MFTVAINSTLYTACIYLPVGTVCGICTATSIIAMAFITIYSNRTFQPKMYIGATVSFIGIILLIQPEFLMFPVVEVRNTSWESPCLPRNNETDLHRNQTKRTVTTLSDSMLGYTLAAASGIIMAIYLQLQKYYVTDADPFAMTMWRFMAGTAISVILMLIMEEIRSALYIVTTWSLHFNCCWCNCISICHEDFICITYKSFAIPQPCEPGDIAVHINEEYSTSQGKLVGSSRGSSVFLWFCWWNNIRVNSAKACGTG